MNQNKVKKIIKYLNVLFYIFITATFIAFYYGLRYDDKGLLPTLLSLLLLGVTYLIHFVIKKQKKKLED